MRLVFKHEITFILVKPANKKLKIFDLTKEYILKINSIFGAGALK
ncbi:hypothetical protein DESAMIL20_2038 [Desulfurella amilsii]|uniref:Uncharacterized protein n=1 Tax=Desulfurella amilsii TaxID=1562698 RepID=A0A1X4XU91_9BACT|nr:hypothetical protein DESAMIL20_2038 [Desulfurella amilsii]